MAMAARAGVARASWPVLLPVIRLRQLGSSAARGNWNLLFRLGAAYPVSALDHCALLVSQYFLRLLAVHLPQPPGTGPPRAAAADRTDYRCRASSCWSRCISPSSGLAADGIPGALFNLLAVFDKPFNQAPSLHIALLVILWDRYAAHTGGAWRWLLHGWFALIGVSVLTTYQHHVIDVPTGMLLGFLCLWLWPETGAPPLSGFRLTASPQRRKIGSISKSAPVQPSSAGARRKN